MTTNTWLERRSSRRRILQTATVAGAVAAFATACGGGDSKDSGSASSPAAGGQATAASGEPKRGGRLRVNMGAQNVFLDPHMTALPGVSWLWGNISHHLVEIAPDRSITDEGLAKSWEIPDALTFVFKLHDGIKFHDLPPANGRPMTAEDVKYSFERMRTPDPQFARRALFETIDKMETPDPQTLKITLKKAYVPQLFYFGSGWAFIVNRETVEKLGDLKGPEGAIGVGPFILEPGYTKEQGGKLRRNPNYFRSGLPYLDNVDLMVFADAQTAQAAFTAGQVDVNGINADAKKVIQGAVRGAQFLPVSHGGRRYSVEFSFKRQPYGDPRLRKALHLALNRQEVISLGWADEGDLLGGIPPSMGDYALQADELEKMPGYRPNKTEDLAEAKKLLSAAGFDNLEITFSDTKLAIPLGEIIPPQLGKIGIKSRVNEIEYGAYKTAENNHEYAAFMGGYTVDPEPDAVLRLYSSSTGSRNYNDNADPRLDQMIDQQAGEVDDKKRAALVKDIQRYMIETNAEHLLANGRSYKALQPYVRGLIAPPWSDSDRQDVTRVWLDR
jgi:peptide/nickel transport system substrate-binding protein